MSKKNFQSGLSSLLESTISSKPKSNKKKPVNKKYVSDHNLQASKNPTPKIEKRTTFILDEEQLNVLKAFAFWERKLLKDVVYEAIDQYLSAQNPKHIQEAKDLYMKSGRQTKFS